MAQDRSNKPKSGSPSPLGRGLAALLGDLEGQDRDTATDAQVMEVDLSQIAPSEGQPRKRFTQEALVTLAESIREHGVIQPILVRPVDNAKAKYEIVAGERRWRACQMAGLDTVPVVIKDLTDTTAFALALVENLQREDLSPIEEAEGYRTLIDQFGISQAALAEMVGVSRPAISNALRLLKLPETIQDLVTSGQLSVGHAKLLVGLKAPEAIAAKIIASDLSVRETEALLAAQSKSSPFDRPRYGTKDPNVVDLENRIWEKLAVKANVTVNKKGGGAIKLHFNSAEHLDKILAALEIDK